VESKVCIAIAEEKDYVRWSKNVYQSMVMITQFGINMLVPIFLCSFIGIFLDRKFGTSFLMVLFFFIGALAGFRNVYLFARKIYTQESGRGGKSNQNEHNGYDGTDKED
jgi:F0F1-type ATP synthase assembly protein I